jgi:hypothetical protein
VDFKGRTLSINIVSKVICFELNGMHYTGRWLQTMKKEMAWESTILMFRQKAAETTKL